MTLTTYLWDGQNYLSEEESGATTVYTNEPLTHGNLVSQSQKRKLTLVPLQRQGGFKRTHWQQ